MYKRQSLLGRATRFFVVATLLRFYGIAIKNFIESYLGWMFLIFVILFIVGGIGIDFL